jgi:hypothetical protein
LLHIYITNKITVKKNEYIDSKRNK